MGDRANVLVLGDKFDGRDASGVYLYGHSVGTALQERALNELQVFPATDRWDDSSYLTRILFHRILESSADSSSPYGFGISASLTDNEHPVLVLDPNSCRAALRPLGVDPMWWVGEDEGILFADSPTLSDLQLLVVS